MRHLRHQGWSLVITFVLRSFQWLVIPITQRHNRLPRESIRSETKAMSFFLFLGHDSSQTPKSEWSAPGCLERLWCAIHHNPATTRLTQHADKMQIETLPTHIPSIDVPIHAFEVTRLFCDSMGGPTPTPLVRQPRPR
jgi:hypothetical protein